jgi:hypothetical protein
MVTQIIGTTSWVYTEHRKGLETGVSGPVLVFGSVFKFWNYSKDRGFFCQQKKNGAGRLPENWRKEPAAQENGPTPRALASPGFSGERRRRPKSPDRPGGKGFWPKAAFSHSAAPAKKSPAGGRVKPLASFRPGFLNGALF